jgi:hypothetical protein
VCGGLVSPNGGYVFVDSEHWLSWLLSFSLSLLLALYTFYFLLARTLYTQAHVTLHHKAKPKDNTSEALVCLLDLPSRVDGRE